MSWALLTTCITGALLLLLALVLGAVLSGALALVCAIVTGVRRAGGGRSDGSWWWT